METLIFKYALVIHVICGFLSLVTGAVAMSVKKGGKTHHVAGLIFYWAMFGIFVTTVLFFVLYPEKIKYQFFLTIGIVSFYPNWSGKRMIQMKKGLSPTLTDKVAAFGIGISGLVMLGYAFYGFSNGNIQDVFQILFVIFGIVSLFNAYGDLKLYLGFQQAPKMHWFFAHAGKMTGAYAAAMTAFFVNIVPRYLPDNLPSAYQVATWVVPGILIGIVGNRISKKYKVKFKLIPAGK
jgi:hypothetical protein